MFFLAREWLTNQNVMDHISFFIFIFSFNHKVFLTIDNLNDWLISRMSNIFCKYCRYQLNTIRTLNNYNFNYTNELIGFQ